MDGEEERKPFKGTGGTNSSKASGTKRRTLSFFARRPMDSHNLADSRVFPLSNYLVQVTGGVQVVVLLNLVKNLS
jgi:hypothetical protein